MPCPQPSPGRGAPRDGHCEPSTAVSPSSGRRKSSGPWALSTPAKYSNCAMICSMSSWGRIVVLAEEQWGMFTRQQAAQRGMAWSTLSRMASKGRAERVGHGVYRLRGAEPPAQAALRVAWLMLAPSVPVWGRSADQGVVSHRSAATLFGLGDLPADVHEFTLPIRRQTRREDVRVHRGDVADGVVSQGGCSRPALRGMPSTCSKTALIRPPCQRSWPSRSRPVTTDPPS